MSLVHYNLFYGEVTEWFKVTVLKTVVGQLTASSNLALSAIENRGQATPVFYGEGAGAIRSYRLYRST